jgi:hypothetical protein
MSYPLLYPNNRDAEGEGGTAEALLGVPGRVRYAPDEGQPQILRIISRPMPRWRRGRVPRR